MTTGSQTRASADPLPTTQPDRVIPLDGLPYRVPRPIADLIDDLYLREANAKARYDMERIALLAHKEAEGGAMILTLAVFAFVAFAMGLAIGAWLL